MKGNKSVVKIIPHFGYKHVFNTNEKAYSDKYIGKCKNVFKLCKVLCIICFTFVYAIFQHSYKDFSIAIMSMNLTASIFYWIIYEMTLKLSIPHPITTPRFFIFINLKNLLLCIMCTII